MSAPVFLASREALGEDVVRLDGVEGRHAATVRRIRVGEQVDLTDGRGLVVHGAVASVGRDQAEVTVVSRASVPPPQPRIVVVQALPKGDRGESAVAMMTEVGVDEIVPWAASRCITVWRPDRAERAVGKWRSAATAAAKQARRWWHPVVGDPTTTPAVADRLREAALAVVLHESADGALSELDVPASGEVVLVVGPEGGLTDDEVSTFRAAGAVVARMGPTVLRTSTAGVAAAAVVLSRTDRWRG